MLKCNMIPLLLISNNDERIKEYLKETEDKESLFFSIVPEKKEYSINEIKNLRRETSIYNRKKRVYLLENFHRSSLEAQNAFLKLLEEPPSNVLFILTSDNEERLLPTIVSRTKLVFLGRGEAKVDLPKVVNLLENFILNNKTDLSIADKLSIEEIILFFRNRLLTDDKASSIIREILKVKNLIERNNLNLQLAIDHILIFIKKQYTIKSDHEK